MNKIPDTKQSTTLSVSVGRRRLLKALAAGSGSLALTGLPSRWNAPVIEIGLLPVHAQSSAPSLSPPSSQPKGTTCDANGVDGQVVTIQFEYTSPGGNVLPGSVVQQSYRFSPSGSSGSNRKPLTDTEINGTSTSGTVTYQNCIAFADNDTELQLTLVLVDIAGNASSPAILTIAAIGMMAGQSIVTLR